MTRNIVGMVLEVAVNDVYARLGVKGPSTILQSMDDVLQFLLPCRTLLMASQDDTFFRAVRTASLLDKVRSRLPRANPVPYVDAIPDPILKFLR